MSVFYPAAKLAPGETTVWSCRGQLSTPHRAFAPGTLILTAHRLVFQPARFAFSGSVLSYELRDCASVETVERTWTAHDGGAHRRIRLTLADRTTVLFVVKQVDEVAAFLNDAVRRHAERDAA